MRVRGCDEILCPVNVRATQLLVPKPDEKLCKGKTDHGRFMVLYMCSSFWLLGVESRDFSQAEKERTACKAEQIHKMTTIFTQNDNLGPF